jgi:NTP pyrophosphatase (non-canonical NTP hydrolase)
MIDKRLATKGSGAFVGPHEILGIVAEEYDELLEAVRSDNQGEIYYELLDIAVAAVIGMCSMTVNELNEKTGK